MNQFKEQKVDEGCNFGQVGSHSNGLKNKFLSIDNSSPSPSHINETMPSSQLRLNCIYIYIYIFFFFPLDNNSLLSDEDTSRFFV